ncbi:hypothetical protein F4680DRAFT_442365 [Xylaria scruposa]|nr:hypothetical protein F4680DRAFT_442365 [Xylaria scruposa]
MFDDPVGIKTIKVLNIVSAIVPKLAPTVEDLDGSDGTASKMVDYYPTIKPKSPKKVERIAIKQSSEALCTINQSTNTPLCHNPVVIIVETKVETAPTSGEPQLAIWTPT